MPRNRRIGLQHGRGMAARRQAQTQAPGVQHEHGGGRSQGPAHGQGIGVGLYLLTVGGGPPSRSGAVPLPDEYAPVVLADAPLAYWRLGESGGTAVADSSSTGTFTGTYINTPTLAQPGIPGASGNAAAQFNSPGGTAAGNQQAATFGDVLPLNGTKLTLEFWFKQIAPAPGFSPFVARGDTTWRVSTSAVATQIQFTVGTGQLTVTPATMADGNWHHVACVYNQTNLLTYYDGAQAGTTAFSTNLPTSSGKNVGIGYNSDQTTRFLHHVIDEVAIYNTALSAGRVLAHYNAGIA